MIGLIKKDFLMIKGNIKFSIIIILVFSLISYNNINMLEFIPIFISTMLCMSLFSYDEYNKWDAYACTFPNGRVNIVKSKYITNIILILISFFFTLILSSTISLIKYNSTTKNIIDVLYGVSFVSVLLITFTYPLIFKFGIEKGRILLFFLVFGLSGIFALLYNNLNINLSSKITEIFNVYYLIIIPLASVIILYISYLISKHIYLKKEF